MPLLFAQYVGGYYGGCSEYDMVSEIYNYGIYVESRQPCSLKNNDINSLYTMLLGPISVGFEVLNNFMSYSGGMILERIISEDDVSTEAYH